MRCGILVPSLALQLSIAMLAALSPVRAAEGPSSDFLDGLQPGQEAHGFRAESVYLDEADHPMGGRFVHTRTGFVFDLVHIQSVPQVFLWVRSFPTSDMGEPHTQEHLLLGKGNKGRHVANVEEMSLTDSNAFTQQWRTCYSFNTSAGAETFYRVLEARLDGLLHPDYSDEEIRREVRNFGLSVNAEDASLLLEEKGTVYNEMVSSFERGWSRLDREMSIALYGPRHPLAFVSGGLPSAIREMKAEHIRKFHHDAYHLGNMGMVGALPREMPAEQALVRLGAILDKVQPPAETEGRRASSENDLPAPEGAKAGEVEVVEYPHQNAEQPGVVLMGWAPERTLSSRDWVLLNFFVSNVAGDPTTNLYKLFIDTQTRKLDIGAQSVFGWISEDRGHPVYLGFEDVGAANLQVEKLKAIRQLVTDEIARIAAFADGSPELAAFNDRIRSRILESRRQYGRFITSPPGFGQRGTGSEWMDHIDVVAGTEGFRKSLVFKDELASIEASLDSGKNFWRERLEAWKLTGNVPYAMAAKASPELLKREADERTERIKAEVARLGTGYGTKADQDTLKRYQTDYDAETKRLDEIARKTETPRFIDDPPLTLDDRLDYQVESVNGVPMVTSRFEMSRSSLGLATRVDTVPVDRLPYLAILPDLLTSVGVIEDGKPVSFDVMSERLRREILGLEARFSSNASTRRVELVVVGSGSTAAESDRAVQWMKLVLTNPDWRPENLPRIREVVDQSLAGFRNTMQASEESWVQGPAQAYRRQDSLAYLAATSFLTRAQLVLRLRWRLKDAGPEPEVVAGWLTALGGAAEGSDRKALGTLLASIQGHEAAEPVPAGLAKVLESSRALSESGRGLASEAAKDLEALLPDLPESTLAADWKDLCLRMRDDLLVPPATALQELDGARRAILRSGNARLFFIGSKESRQKLDAPIRERLLTSLEAGPAEAAPAPEPGVIRARLTQRDPAVTKPVFVGLLQPNTQGGVFLNSVPATQYANSDRESLLRYLATLLYGGGGAHSIFMKTWGAGLAYSNGVGSSPASGRLSYYAERCPELPQTLRFVIDTLKSAQKDPGLGEYAIAQAFFSRADDEYESRGEAMAADLADGVTPDLVTKFRAGILDLRKEPGLVDELYERMHVAYARVLPGYDKSMKLDSIADAVYMVIGPEKQLAGYEQYLKSAVGPESTLVRLYQRDFWIPASASGSDPAPGASGTAP